MKTLNQSRSNEVRNPESGLCGCCRLRSVWTQSAFPIPEAWEMLDAERVINQMRNVSIGGPRNELIVIRAPRSESECLNALSAARSGLGMIRPGARRSGTRRSLFAFTLIELLVVISIIALMAALLFPVGAAVKRHIYLNVARAELEQTSAALEAYKSQYGVYPPSNLTNMLINPLYYELSGVSNYVSTTTGNSYETLDNASSVSVTAYTSGFGVGGAVNCVKPGGDVESVKARRFLPALKPNRINTLYGLNGPNILVTSVGGPDQNYLTQLQGMGFGGNPFRYIYPGTNNPSSYDLYVQLSISGKKYLISNWSKENVINSPLP
jgi:prepilin-type N-terminal cleavage/methylation domain-containing protein